MFGALTEKFQGIVSSLSKKKALTEENISDAVREVRLALLDADVNYAVTKNLIKRVKEKALGETVIKSVSAGEQFTKIVHDELVELMGSKEPEIVFSGLPTVIMMCGLQGSGKTTHTAKIAHYLSKKEYDKSVLVIACDRQRPAAVLQLKTLCSSIEVPVFDIEGSTDPIKVAKEGMKEARKKGYDVVIVDTAGRLHIDDELMKELEKLNKVCEPHEVLFVANATTGQDAVKTAAEFDSRIGITGSILTMLDGNARAGAAISIREITGKPLKFEGIGEKITDLQLFNPHSMADRILGMGDIINLVKRAEEHSSEEEAEDLEKKFRKANFTYDDYLKQMGKLKKMGSMKSLLKMLPGMGNMPDIDMSDGEFSKLEAMILSMTKRERLGRDELEPARRRRIASGSGTTIDDVNRMVKGFKRLRQMMKKMGSMKKSLKKMGGMDEAFSKLSAGKSRF